MALMEAMPVGLLAVSAPIRFAHQAQFSQRAEEFVRRLDRRAARAAAAVG